MTCCLESRRTWDLPDNMGRVPLQPRNVASGGQGLPVLFTTVLLVPKTTLRLAGAQKIGMDESCWRRGPVEQEKCSIFGRATVTQKVCP